MVVSSEREQWMQNEGRADGWLNSPHKTDTAGDLSVTPPRTRFSLSADSFVSFLCSGHYLLSRRATEALLSAARAHMGCSPKGHFQKFNISGLNFKWIS